MNVPPDVLSPIDCQSCRVLSLEGGRTSTSRAALVRVGRAPNASNDIENVTSRVFILALSGRQEVFPLLCKDNPSRCWRLLCDTEQILASASFSHSRCSNMQAGGGAQATSRSRRSRWLPR